MQEQSIKNFSEAENITWGALFSGLDRCRKDQAHPIFSKGVEILGLTDHSIPNINEVNGILQELTGWQGVPVEGLEDNTSFFPGMAAKKFPIGNFIRDARDVNYTPAPDIFHDLYGHLPFMTDPDFAKFCQEFGAIASKYIDDEAKLEMWGRLFWFGVEFPIVKTPHGNRIFGGGILSSLGESDFSLSRDPEVLPFDIVAIRDRPYKIDEFQRTLFLLESPQQLYGCLKDFEDAVNSK